MPEIDYEAPLDDAEQEWIRVRFSTLGGRVTTYAVQYETSIAGRRIPVVRFDNAHGFPHRDLLDRNGRAVEKRPIAGKPTPGAALKQGQQDIQTN